MRPTTITYPPNGVKPIGVMELCMACVKQGSAMLKQ